MVQNKIEAVEYIQKIWYRSKFDPGLATIALSYVDDPYIINHIQGKIAKMSQAEADEIRKKDYHKRGRYFVKKHRAVILETLKARDGDHCARCKKHKDSYQIDHIVPLKSFGDPESMDNLQLLCPLCNKILGERTKKPFDK